MSAEKRAAKPSGLLSVAGFDPTGGAGVLLDIRVFESLGFRGLGVITSVTSQSPDRFQGAVHLPPRTVTGQYRPLEGGYEILGVKVGMIGSLGNLAAAARILGGNPDVPRVVDPVFASSSGARLLEKKAVPRFLGAFAGKADLVTPNLAEAAALAGRPVTTGPEMREAALRIFERSGIPCLLKGGHLPGGPVDLLYDGKSFREFRNRRVDKSVHGTGCFLSSAVLAYLADGRGLEEACGLAIELTQQAIRGAAPAGGGRAVFRFPLVLP